MLTAKKGADPIYKTIKWGLTPCVLVVALAGAGVWQLGAGAWIHVKAQLAQWLVARAWAQTVAGDTPVRPWPGADTWPLARLRIRSLGLDVIVLHGHSGRSLAFAPGLAPGSAPPGRPGTKVISAHRDTHFSALAGLEMGDLIELQTATGHWHYRAVAAQVMDTRSEQIVNDPLSDELVLVTCYPFDALVPGGPLRYVIYAASDAETDL